MSAKWHELPENQPHVSTLYHLILGDVIQLMRDNPDGAWLESHIAGALDISPDDRMLLWGVLRHGVDQKLLGVDFHPEEEWSWFTLGERAQRRQE